MAVRAACAVAAIRRTSAAPREIGRSAHSATAAPERHALCTGALGVLVARSCRGTARGLTHGALRADRLRPKRAALTRCALLPLCTAAEAGLVSSKEEFQRKMTRYNTKEMYTQPKYNLLREESEGYSFSFSCRMHP